MNKNNNEPEIILEPISDDCASSKTVEEDKNIEVDFEIPEDAAIFTFDTLPTNAINIDSDNWVITNKHCDSDSFKRLRNLCTTIPVNFRSISLYFPNLLYFVDGALEGCTGVVKISAPKAEKLGCRSFYKCDSLKYISLASVTKIDDGYIPLSLRTPFAFGYLRINKTEYNAVVKKVISSVFAHCTSLEIILLPNANKIGNYTFYGCIRLKEISLPVNANISSNAFDEVLCKDGIIKHY